MLRYIVDHVHRLEILKACPCAAASEHTITTAEMRTCFANAPEAPPKAWPGTRDVQTHFEVAALRASWRSSAATSPYRVRSRPLREWTRCAMRTVFVASGMTSASIAFGSSAGFSLTPPRFREADGVLFSSVQRLTRRGAACHNQPLSLSRKARCRMVRFIFLSEIFAFNEVSCCINPHHHCDFTPLVPGVGLGP